MKKITAKFNSTCTETDVKIKKGESMYYDYATKKCYSINSQKAKQYEHDDFKQAGDMAQAEQEAYFDNFCINNGI